jgi:hypothetical protein
VEIKEILYAEIDKMGKNQIRTLLSNDVSNSKSIINLLLNNCIDSLNKYNLIEDDLVLFAEALLHFVLTMSMIPAERKISVDDIAVDILVPNSKNLKDDNNKAIIIHFFKDKYENINESIAKLSQIQENTNNIWIISSKKINNLNLNTFIVSSSSLIYPNNDYNDNFSYPFSDILIKIDEFLKSINYSGLKIF